MPVTGVTNGGINNTGSSGTSTATSYRVLETSGTSVTITINNWIIKGGNIGNNGAGGCIRNTADKLVLNDVTISNGRSSYTTSGSIVLGNGAVLPPEAMDLMQPKQEIILCLATIIPPELGRL